MAQTGYQKIRTSYKRARGFGNYFMSKEFNSQEFFKLKKELEQLEIYPHSKLL